MQVETYEVEEIKGEMETLAADSEAIELCGKLGLTGQLSITNEATATRNPYREITAEERAIFQTCFPNQTKLAEYRDGIIPLRVLQVAARCREGGMFSEFFVWHPPRGVVDPVLVGIIKRKLTASYGEYSVDDTYLLARWGTSLLPLDELREKARTLLLARWKSKLITAQSEIETGLKVFEARADEMLNGVKAYTDPYFNW